MGKSRNATQSVEKFNYRGTRIEVYGLDLIQSIEIKYFRSIYNLVLKDTKSLNVFSGKNDVGKSNILKAINLFFNDFTESETPLDFYKDFSVKRLQQVRQESIKGKQFISVKVTFLRGNRCENTLPERFSVTKKWYRYSKVPEISDDLKIRLSWIGKNSDRDLTLAKTSLTRFMNSLKYIYVPAIKDVNVFTRLIGNLQDAVFDIKDTGLSDQLAALNNSIVGLVDEINDDFHAATGIESTIGLPNTLRDLYKAFFIHTKFGKEDHKIPLEQRGDGIRIRYIPSMLNYITNKSNFQYIWGFEEPENSLEYCLCVKMATDFMKCYANDAQIFITSHSPAFFSLEGERVEVKRVVLEDFETKVFEDSEYKDFIDELGLIELQKEINQIVLSRLADIEKVQERVAILEATIRAAQLPIVLTEGKTDKSILRTAWEALYPGSSLPFLIDCCDVLPIDEGESGAGGYDTLLKSLETARPSNPHIIIGVFDHDKAGVEKGFNKLSKNFIQYQENIKIHKNKKAAAVLLPVPPGKEKFAEFLNLPIEFYFSEKALSKKIDGKGLSLIPQKKQIKSETGMIIEEMDATEPYLMKIGNNKKVFSEEIVPTLDKEEFLGFDVLFKQIVSLCSTMGVATEAAAASGS
ncbi:MAG: ATP-binding protein [Peptococcaceae bacterium]|nr:ATP-binding protein [Peptococcaceae bacterium]